VNSTRLHVYTRASLTDMLVRILARKSARVGQVGGQVGEDRRACSDRGKLNGEVAGHFRASRGTPTSARGSSRESRRGCPCRCRCRCRCRSHGIPAKSAPTNSADLCGLWRSLFYPRDDTPARDMLWSRVRLYLCMSVCLSQAGVVSKRLSGLSCFGHRCIPDCL